MRVERPYPAKTLEGPAKKMFDKETGFKIGILRRRGKFSYPPRGRLRHAGGTPK